MGKCNVMKDKLCIEIVYVFDVVIVVERFIDLDFFLYCFMIVVQIYIILQFLDIEYIGKLNK